jgi:hypothetical protein
LTGGGVKQTWEIAAAEGADGRIPATHTYRAARRLRAGGEFPLGLLKAIIERSRERVAALDRIAPEARRYGAAGIRHPALTLSLGIAFHKAIIDVCAKFEEELGGANNPRTGRPGCDDLRKRARMTAMNRQGPSVRQRG